MIKGTTKSGFDFEIQDEAIDNMEVMDALAELNAFDVNEASEGDSVNGIFAMSNVASLLLGKKQKENLYKHIKGIHGKVTIEVFMEEMAEILSSESVKN